VVEAVYITCVVEPQIVVCEAEIEIPGATVEAENESVIVLLVAVVGFAHEALLVKTQYTASLFAGDESVYVLEFVPTVTPFLNHWKTGFVPPFMAVAV
jgi:hypothetical protein